MPVPATSMTAAAPLYRGIVDDIENRIRSGRLAPGAQIPTIESICDCYHVSAITAKRAVAELQALGVVRSVRGKGTFVSHPPPEVPQEGPPQSPGGKQTPLRAVVLVASFSTRPDGHAGFFGPIWDAIAAAAAARGLDFRVQAVPEGGSDFHVDLSFEPAAGGGVIFVTATYPYRIMHLVHDRQVPGVTVDAASFLTSAVVSDNLAGVRELVDHLKALGHRRLLMAHNYPASPNPTNENERMAALEFLCQDRGLAGEVMPASDFEAIFRRLGGRQAPTAVMFNQDTPARLFLQRAAEQGLRVPEDLSITGFDGWSAQGNGPALTTIAVDREAMGRAAVELLVEVAASRHAGISVPRWVRIPGRLVPGHTAGPAR